MVSTLVSSSSLYYVTEFRKIPDEEKLNAWKGLLKGTSCAGPGLRGFMLTILQHIKEKWTTSLRGRKRLRMLS